MSDSRNFHLLHKDIQRWVWKQQWTSLRDIQENSIEVILNADSDVIISASTAAGKTEAAFLPACSRIAEKRSNGIGILYISPLKALINDQYRRLQSLCESLDIPVTPWHGDVLHSLKSKQKKNPHGIILITPESLESLMLNRAHWCARAFAGLHCIIIDEFHSFLGSERGCQLLSLMHRIEFMLKRTIPRIALSATLGDMPQVARYLRPSTTGFPCRIIESSASGSDVKIQLRGYVNPLRDDNPLQAFQKVVNDLYLILRGKSHLIFANTRKRTEELAAALSERCMNDGVPNEFFPHHGSLAKDIREGLEARLQQARHPTSAVCTMTLELGIDIGNVDSVAQVTAPHSVASLRQRLGRSGRRGDPAVLRLFIPEKELSTNSHLLDRLRSETVQCIAIVNLLINKWCEPAPENQYHLSTLVQQTLSVIGQYGGVRADQLWSLLCKTGPFSLVGTPLYAGFLRSLGEQEYITQTGDGLLVLGIKGEKLVENHTFYTAFNTPDEYHLECDGQTIGTLPIDKPLVIGQSIIFAGKRWKILAMSAERKVIFLERASGGKPPEFGGSSQMVHDRVRQEMLRVYSQRFIPAYLDKNAQAAFEEGLEHFQALDLANNRVVQIGNTIHILPWLGDRVANTITLLFRRAGISADCTGGIIDISDISLETFHSRLESMLQNARPSPEELAEHVTDTLIEKHDLLLPDEMRKMAYGAKYFDMDRAFQTLSELHRNKP